VILSPAAQAALERKSRPWHETQPMPEGALEASRDAFAKLSKREKNSALWQEAYAAARDGGFEPQRAAEIATGEVRTASRFTAAAVRVATKMRRPEALPLDTDACTTVFDGTAFRRISDADEDTPDLPFTNPISEARRALVEQAEKEFSEDANTETGMSLSPEQYEARRKDRGVTRRQSKQIVERLREGGVQAMRDDEFRLWRYFVHTKRWEEIPAYRRICFIPDVAAQIRAPKLAALEYFIQNNPFCRFWTFTTGERCKVDEIEGRLAWLNKNLRKMNCELRERFGVDIVFKSIEFGSLEKRARGKVATEDEAGGSIDFENGEPLYHPHAHCVVHLSRGYLVPAVWAQVIATVNKWWKRGRKRVHWDCAGGDSGALIRNARECVKYVSKPADLLKLSAEQLVKLFNVTYRAKLCQPMGILAEEIRIRDGHVYEVAQFSKKKKPTPRTLREIAAKFELPLSHILANNPGVDGAEADPDQMLLPRAQVVIHAGGKCLRRVRNGVRMEWRERLNHNAQNRETPAEKAARIGLEDTFAFTDECAHLANVEPPSYPGALDGGSPAPRLKKGAPGCKVMARLMPAAGDTRVKEPCVIVMGTRFDLGAVQSHPLVYKLWSDTVVSWEMGRVLAASESEFTPAHQVSRDLDEAALLAEEPPPPDPLRARMSALSESLAR
jgi:hypothetical protein